MSLLSNVKKKNYWVNVVKIGIPFLIVVTVFILLFNSGKSIFSGDFETVYNTHFSNKKWVRVWLTKLVISLGYGMYVANKNMK